MRPLPRGSDDSRKSRLGLGKLSYATNRLATGEIQSGESEPLHPCFRVALTDELTIAIGEDLFTITGIRKYFNGCPRSDSSLKYRKASLERVVGGMAPCRIGGS
jgi:hypothetical protein